MLSSARHTARLFHIGMTLARHDALFVLEDIRCPTLVTFICKCLARRKVEDRKGKRLARAFESLGPTFIKFGQLLSTRPDLVGESIAHDLAELRDQIPPFDSKIAMRMVESEFDKQIGELFSHFDEKPIAAASIAQVHFAVTPEGKDVAVKILRPDVRAQFKQDIDLFFWLARMVERRMPQYDRLKPVQMVQALADSVRMELDLRFEAAAASELRENTLKDEGFYVPEVDWLRTSGNVLTTERIIGIPLGDIDAIKAANIDCQKLVENAAKAFFNQVFRDGFFHADMHPGNLFVLPDSTIAAVDFGIMGRLDRKSQLYIADILWGFLREDYMHVSQVHFDAGYVPKTQSVANFALACRAIAEPILNKPLHEISIGRLLGLLFEIAETFQMQAQPQLLMLQKTMVIAEGVGRMIYPEVNMWKTAEPLIAEWGKSNLSPKARIKDTVKETLEAAQKLPEVLHKIESAIEALSGGIELHPRTLDHFKESSSRWPWFFFGLGIMTLLGLILAEQADWIRL